MMGFVNGSAPGRADAKRARVCRGLETGEDQLVAREINRHIARGVADYASDRLGELVKDVQFLAGTVLSAPQRRYKKLRRAEEIAHDDSAFVSVGDPAIRIHYQVSEAHGVPKSRTARDGLMVHGLLGSTFSYRKIQGKLASLMQGRIASFDLPGFGLTERPDSLKWRRETGVDNCPYHSSYSAQLTSKMIEALDMKNAVLFGHSLGGSIALEAALSGANIGALVLLSPAVRIIRPPAALKSVVNSVLATPLIGKAAVRWVFLNCTRENRIERLIERNFHNLDRIGLEETIEGYTRPMQVRDWDRGLSHFSMSFDGFDYLDDPRIAKLDIPVLIISGEYDRVLQPVEMKELSKRLPKATYHCISDCGHIPQEELPGKTMGIIEKWLDALPN